jgi:hydroxyacyl-ACP dehydratase HTD2-like protein with hotdog domain
MKKLFTKKCTEAIQTLNSGSTKDSFMQNCLRELCFVEATHEFEVRAKHIAGEENRLAVYLSRLGRTRIYNYHRGFIITENQKCFPF